MTDSFSLRPVKTKEDIELFAKYKVELIKLHQPYANKLGLVDHVVDAYDENSALKYRNKDDYFQCLICLSGQTVGVLEYQITTSEIDDHEILNLENLYILPRHRGCGLGKKVIAELKKQNKRIELECWYGLPANDFYESLNMKVIKTRYMLEPNSLVGNQI